MKETAECSAPFTTSQLTTVQLTSPSIRRRRRGVRTLAPYKCQSCSPAEQALSSVCYFFKADGIIIIIVLLVRSSSGISSQEKTKSNGLDQDVESLLSFLHKTLKVFCSKLALLMCWKCQVISMFPPSLNLPREETVGHTGKKQRSRRRKVSSWSIMAILPFKQQQQQQS